MTLNTDVLEEFQLSLEIFLMLNKALAVPSSAKKIKIPMLFAALSGTCC